MFPSTVRATIVIFLDFADTDWYIPSCSRQLLKTRLCQTSLAFPGTSYRVMPTLRALAIAFESAFCLLMVCLQFHNLYLIERVELYRLAYSFCQDLDNRVTQNHEDEG